MLNHKKCVICDTPTHLVKYFCDECAMRQEGLSHHNFDSEWVTIDRITDCRSWIVEIYIFYLKNGELKTSSKILADKLTLKQAEKIINNFSMWQ